MVITETTNKALGVHTVSPSQNRRITGAGLSVCVAVCLYFVLAVCNLKQPGLYYDEALFINAALGAPDNDSFVAYRIMGIPIMTMQYIGAVKSYLFAPIFALFGVNIFTIRIPAILLSCATLVMCFKVISRFTGAKVAAVASLLLAIDPCFVLHTRADHGPIVLMMLLKMTSVYFFFRSIDRKSWRSFAIGLLVLLIGLWDKLNFVWFVAAMFCASLIYFRPVLQLFRMRTVPMVCSTIIFLASLGVIFFQLIAPLLHTSGHSSLNIQRWLWALNKSQETLTGTYFCNWVFVTFKTLPALCPAMLLPFITIAAIAIFIWSKDSAQREQLRYYCKGILFFGFLYYGIFFQIALTPEAGGPHHFMVLWPFHYIVIFLASSMLLQCSIPKFGKYVATVLASSALAVFVFNAYVTSTIIAALPEQHLNPLWSTGIYDLARKVRRISDDYQFVVSTDWGLHTQVSALIYKRQRPKCLDFWPVFNDMTPNGPSERWIASLTKATPFLAILYAPGLSHFPNTRSHFFGMVSRSQLNCVPIETIRDPSGAVYELYSVSSEKKKIGQSIEVPES